MRHVELRELFNEVFALRTAEGAEQLNHIGGPVLAFQRAMDVANMELEGLDTLFCLKEGNRGELDEVKWLDAQQCTSSLFAHKVRY